LTKSSYFQQSSIFETLKPLNVVALLLILTTFCLMLFSSAITNAFYRATAKNTHGIAVEILSVRPSVKRVRVLWQNEST